MGWAMPTRDPKPSGKLYRLTRDYAVYTRLMRVTRRFGSNGLQLSQKTLQTIEGLEVRLGSNP